MRYGPFREMFAWQHYGVKPDVMTVARALGNGLPIGAFLAWGKAASAMVPGDHGTTYGGNPLVTAGAGAVLDIFEKRRITEHVKEIGAHRVIGGCPHPRKSCCMYPVYPG